MTNLIPGTTNSPGIRRLLNAQTQSETYNRNREKNLRTAIHATDPNHAPNLNSLPTSLLADIYPNLWRYGRNGDLYINQLHAIQNHLEKLNSTGKDTGFLQHFTAAFLGWSDSPEENRVNTILRPYTIQHGTPLPAEELLYPEYGTTGETPAQRLLNHPVWANRDSEKDPFEESLHTFAFITIQYDLLITFRNTMPTLDALLDNYNDLCKRWSIPA